MHLRHLAIGLGAVICAASASAKPAYVLAKTVALGAPDRWDYATFDPPSGRVYVAHGDRVTVIDGRSGTVIGEVEGMPGGTHGIAISHATPEGLTDDGEGAQAVAFDLTTFKVTHRIPAADDADGIALEPATGHAFIVDGDPGKMTVVDPRTNTAVATIDAGEKMEFVVAGDPGVIYAAGEAKRDLLKIDARTNKIVARWAAPDCVSPHGLAFDPRGRRLFMGCVNSLMVVIDADTGRVVSKLPIGRGSDAVAYDLQRKRVFSSNGVDGTLSIYQQAGRDRYTALETIPTAISGRTLALDPASGRLFVVAAQTDPSPTPGGRPRTRPGTLRVLFLDPVK